MNKVFLLVFVFLVYSSSGQKSFVPASPYPITISQPDGTQLFLYAKGDESVHYAVTDDGYTILKNQQGEYEYASLDQSGNLIGTGVAAKNLNKRHFYENAFVSGLKKNIKPVATQREEELKSATISNDFPTEGQNKTLLLLIKYPDLSSTYTTGNFENLMNQPNYGGTGSMRDYYLVNSDNNLELDVDIFGWYTASHNYLYYGEDEGDDVARELVREAVNAAEAAGVDFSAYDNDHNGYVDNLMVVHSGPGAEEGSQTQFVWSHSWSLGSSYSVIYDGVRINDYIIQPETRGYGMVGIGVFCHEFGHALGLPDLYDTDDSSEGLGRWCLMASGSWLNQERTPAMMSAWCREELGWVAPTVIPYPVTAPYYGDYLLQPSATSTQVYKIRTQNTNEYFLLENKYQTGFNAFLPGSGLAIFHINTSRLWNGNNDDETNQLVDLEEADGENDLDLNHNRGDAGDVFPGSSANTVFDDHSTPNARINSGANTGISISDISIDGSTINFTIGAAMTPGSNLTYNPAENSVSVVGTVVDVNLQVTNSGNQASGAFTVGYYLSATTPVTTSGYLMGTDNISTINAGASVNISNSKDISTIPSLLPGTYYIGFIIDSGNSVSETNESDNTYTFDSPQATHTSKPNMTFTQAANSLSVNNNTISIGLEVTNDGNSTAAASYVGYYLSSDQNITASDHLLGTDFVGILNPSGTSAEDLLADIGTALPSLPSGHYYAGFIVDYNAQVAEEDEGDNTWCFTATMIDYCTENRTIFYESICEGDSIIFNGDSYDQTGEYTFYHTGYNGCDSIVVLHLSVNPIHHTILNETICQGDLYQVGSNSYSTAGTYNVTLENLFGCDSLVTLTLSLRQPQVKNLYRYICEGGSITVGPNTYTETGIYETIFPDRFGCDSTIIMHLTVNPVYDTIVYKTICEGETTSVGNYTYNTPGIYTHTLTSRSGCDSIVTLHLSVNNRKEVLFSETICEGDSVVMGGQWYKTTGTFVTTLESYSGCDSVITLQLAVNPLDETSVDTTICQGQSVVFANTSYSVSGIYTHSLQNRFGCDSLVALHLTVVPASDTTLYKEICEGDSVVVAGSVYKQSGFYEKTIISDGGCTSTVFLHLTVYSGAETNLNLQICSGDSVKVGNQVYKTQGNYTHVLQTTFGCDSVVNLHLGVNPTHYVLIKDTICSGDSVLIGSMAYKTSGLYTLDFVNRFGCDSTVVLDLKVNPRNDTSLAVSICEGDFYTVGGTHFDETGTYFINLQNRFGCDSLILLDLDVEQPSDTAISARICSGEKFWIGSTSYHQTGVYTQTIQNSAGCDSLIHLTLTVLPKNETNLAFAICDGDSVKIGNSVYKDQGYYTDILTNQWGCDSIVKTQVTIKPSSITVLNEIICEGETVQFGVEKIGTSGTFVQYLTNYSGCDSIVTLYLLVKPSSQTHLSAEICEGETYLFEGIQCSQSGQYIQSYLNSYGCDSIITLDLIVNQKSFNQLSLEICEGDSVKIGDSIYKQQGNYTYKFENQFGCDSTVMLNLVVHQKQGTQITAEICQGDSVTIGNKVYRQEGFYTDTLTSQHGCDSLVNLSLKVKQNNTTHLTETICDGDNYYFNGTFYTSAGKYTYTTNNMAGCDSIVTLDLTVMPPSDTTIIARIASGDSIVVGSFVYKTAGVYANKLTNQFGCDSIVVLIVTITDAVQSEVIGENQLRFELYPNPASDKTTLEIFNAGPTYSVWILSSDARIAREIKGFAMGGHQTEVLGLENLSQGIYSVVLESGGKLSVKKLVVQ